MEGGGELGMAVVMVSLDSRLFDRPVHPLDLAVGLGMLDLGEPVLDPVFVAAHFEHVGYKQPVSNRMIQCQSHSSPASAAKQSSGAQAVAESGGGMGYAKQYHVETYLREVLIPRTAPLSPHMILNFLAEKALNLPKSY